MNCFLKVTHCLLAGTIVVAPLTVSSFAAPAAPAATAAKADASSRTFEFVYAGAVSELKPATAARVWLPVATSNSDQRVEVVKIDLPAKHELTKEKKYGNAILFFEGLANDKGEIPFSVTYRVTRQEVSPKNGETVTTEQATAFLTPEKLVPAVKVSQKLIDGKAPSGATKAVARQLYDLVDSHMKYDKSGEGWGRGDALWACDSKYGNCTDFHSVFIALCRDVKIPAKFEIGFPLPPKKGSGEVAGYHCWAKYLDGDRWVGVDISEADKHPEMKELLFGTLPSDRVMFTTGRDLELSPAPKNGPVNFLIYPYVEVDGKPHTKFVKKFAYADQ